MTPRGPATMLRPPWSSCGASTPWCSATGNASVPRPRNGDSPGTPGGGVAWEMDGKSGENWEKSEDSSWCFMMFDDVRWLDWWCFMVFNIFRMGLWWVLMGSDGSIAGRGTIRRNERRERFALYNEEFRRGGPDPWDFTKGSKRSNIGSKMDLDLDGFSSSSKCGFKKKCKFNWVYWQGSDHDLKEFKGYLWVYFPGIAIPTGKAMINQWK